MISQSIKSVWWHLFFHWGGFDTPSSWNPILDTLLWKSWLGPCSLPLYAHCISHDAGYVRKGAGLRCFLKSIPSMLNVYFEVSPDWWQSLCQIGCCCALSISATMLYMLNSSVSYPNQFDRFDKPHHQLFCWISNRNKSDTNDSPTFVQKVGLKWLRIYGMSYLRGGYEWASMKGEMLWHYPENMISHAVRADSSERRQSDSAAERKGEYMWIKVLWYSTTVTPIEYLTN